MNKRGFADAPEEPAHGGTAVKRVLIRQGEAASDLIYMNDAYVEPGETVPAHEHTDMEEVFYVLSGQGEMRVGSEVAPVGARDRVIVPPRTAHVLTNSGTARLRLVTFGVRVRGDE
jgi:mannose-6-phosphate isomerase-like protein (cupin superfamily)